MLCQKWQDNMQLLLKYWYANWHLLAFHVAIGLLINHQTLDGLPSAEASKFDYNMSINILSLTRVSFKMHMGQLKIYFRVCIEWILSRKENVFIYSQVYFTVITNNWIFSYMQLMRSKGVSCGSLVSICLLTGKAALVQVE